MKNRDIMFDINSINIQDLIPLTENENLYKSYGIEEQNLQELLNIVIKIKEKVKETFLDNITEKNDIENHFKWCSDKIWSSHKEYRKDKDFINFIYEFMFYDFYLYQDQEILEDFIEILKEIIDIKSVKDRSQFELLISLQNFYNKISK